MFSAFLSAPPAPHSPPAHSTGFRRQVTRAHESGESKEEERLPNERISFVLSVYSLRLVSLPNNVTAFGSDTMQPRCEWTRRPLKLMIP